VLDAEAEDIFEELKAQSRRIDADYYNNQNRAAQAQTQLTASQDFPIFSSSQRGSMFDPSLTIDVELQRIADARVSSNPHDSVSASLLEETSESTTTSTRTRGDTLDKIMAELVESWEREEEEEEEEKERNQKGRSGMFFYLRCITLFCGFSFLYVHKRFSFYICM
jgi:hypothetical protein